MSFSVSNALYVPTQVKNTFLQSVTLRYGAACIAGMIALQVLDRIWTAYKNMNPLNRFPSEVKEQVEKLGYGRWNHAERMPTFAEMDQMGCQVAIGFHRGCPLLVSKVHVREKSGGNVTGTVVPFVFLQGKCYDARKTLFDSEFEVSTKAPTTQKYSFCDKEGNVDGDLSLEVHQGNQDDVEKTKTLLGLLADADVVNSEFATVRLAPKKALS